MQQKISDGQRKAQKREIDAPQKWENTKSVTKRSHARGKGEGIGDSSPDNQSDGAAASE